MTSALDPGHLLSDEAWAAVTAAAVLEAERITAGHLAPEAPPQLMGGARYGTGALPLAGQVSAPSNGGRRPLGAPRFGVLHSAETPLRAGYAASIARYFGTGPGTSCHYMVDPAETWGVLDDALVAWHVGNGNPNSLAVEQAGYAHFSRAEWTTPDGLAQLDRVAAVMRAARDRYGIGLYWMDDQQLRDAHAGRIVGGWATHDQCRRVLGGTSHTDPMPAYPVDLLMARAIGTPAPPPIVPPAQGPVPPVLRWSLPAGHWLGNVAGPAKQHGGNLRYDSAATHALVRNVQQWLILRGCVPGVRPDQCVASGWADGVWEDATDRAMATWHAHYYPQPQPAQCWADDYRRLTA